MWTLTFGLEDTKHETFSSAFDSLKSKWKESGSPAMLETIWITPPNSKVPMFYNSICDMADQLNLP